MTKLDLMTGVLHKQQLAHKANPYPDIHQRIDRLERLRNMVIRHKERLCEALSADFGCRSALSTKAADILPVVEASKFAEKNLVKWMKPERRSSKFPLNFIGARSNVVYQPLGVVGNISPWNFPVGLSFVPVVDIFAAGNRAMLKPSELTSNTSQLIAEIVAENFSEEEFAVVLGDADIAARFSKLPFDHLLFTGSTSIGRLVAKAAAENLVPVTLELGGKNPVLVSDSADIELAAEKIMWAKTLNGGQVCLSPDTVLIHQDKLAAFTQSCEHSVTKMYPNLAGNQDYTHVINDRHAQRLVAMTQEAEKMGAKVVQLGDLNERCVPPSLVFDPEPQTMIASEEVFGGPLSVFTYTDIEQAIDFINNQPKALALYYFGSRSEEIDLVTKKTSSGGMVVNDCIAHQMQEDLPFGGVGHSGMGCYHGFDGFKNFSHARAVFRQSKLDPFRFVRPPYKGSLRKYIDKQLDS